MRKYFNYPFGYIKPALIPSIQARTQRPRVATAALAPRGTNSSLRIRARRQPTAHLPQPQPTQHENDPTQLQSLRLAMPLLRANNRIARQPRRQAPPAPSRLLHKRLRLSSGPKPSPILLPNLHGSVAASIHSEPFHLWRNRAPPPLHLQTRPSISRRHNLTISRQHHRLRSFRRLLLDPLPQSPQIIRHSARPQRLH
jgi:hypothetical protein